MAQSQLILLIILIASVLCLVFILAVGFAIIGIHNELKSLVDLEYKKFNELKGNNGKSLSS